MDEVEISSPYTQAECKGSDPRTLERVKKVVLFPFFFSNFWKLEGERKRLNKWGRECFKKEAQSISVLYHIYWILPLLQ